MEIPDKPAPARFNLSVMEEIALFESHVVTVLKYVDDYNRGEVTLSRLGEQLGQSPAVLRAVFVRAGKKMGTSAKE